MNVLLLAQAAALVAFYACGQNVEERLKKEYVLAIDGGNDELNATFENLVDEFNLYAGRPALRFSAETAQADSLITLTENLQARDGKVGWGQWVTETNEANQVDGFSLKRKRTIDFAMRLEFDKDYVTERLSAAAGSSGHYDLQKLFFHEVGHGLQMPHHPDRRNLMYYEISGEKDFVGFFKSVDAFLDKK